MRFFFVWYKYQGDGIDTMSDILFCKSFSFKNVTQMCPAICAQYLSSFSINILLSFNGSFDFIIEAWPSTCRCKLIV